MGFAWESIAIGGLGLGLYAFLKTERTVNVNEIMLYGSFALVAFGALLGALLSL